MARAVPSRAARARHAGAVLCLAGLWLAMLLWGRNSLDQAVYRALYAGGHPLLVGAARLFTALGEPTFLIAAGIACALWLWYAGRGRLALALTAVILVGRALAEVQKYTIARARPDLDPHLVVVKTSSFPSGHAASSMIFFLAIALTLIAPGRWRRWAVLGAVILSLLIGASRVMLGVHWPSDVIGGWTFGALWVLVTLRASERLFRVHSR
jgi:undecaprenyl-diphosphatase